MKKATAILAILLGGLINLSAEELNIGFVNFQNCVMESEYGKSEQKQMDNVKNQMESLIKDLDKKLADLNGKISDSDYMDTLSPEGEEALKTEFQSAQEEMQRHQGQYYQVMQQSQMRVSQVMAQHISQAAEQVASEQKLSHIVHKDICFYSSPAFDVTEKVIAKMDESFKKEEKANDAPAQEKSAQ